jgi:hypothetical protein
VVQSAVELRQGRGADIQIRQYPGTYHGFAVRGTSKSTLVDAAKRQVSSLTHKCTARRHWLVAF